MYPLTLKLTTQKAQFSSCINLHYPEIINPDIVILYQLGCPFLYYFKGQMRESSYSFICAVKYCPLQII